MNTNYSNYKFEIDGDHLIYTFDGLIDTLMDHYDPEIHEASPDQVAANINKVLASFADARMDKWVGEIEGLGMVKIVKM